MNLEELKKIREKAQRDLQLRQKQARIRIVVGMGTSGIAAGAREVLKTFLEEIGRRGLTDVVVTQTGEKGLASREPIVEVYEENKPVIIYGNINSEKAKRIVVEHVVNGNPVTEFAIEAI
ncbi:MAG: (2Fe-2S) ferredoxin domain-containing protein [Syntrophorhabdaceae bacterium]|nr:(2Fe-2S) ferredoxin domain-containing protein [Syntrophorhabdaceae bacterium]